MTSGLNNSIFIDANILVYANTDSAPLHQLALDTVQNLYGAGNELWISRQVLREYIATVTRPQTYANPRPLPIVIQRIRFFITTFRIAEDGPDVTDRLLDLLTQFRVGGRQIHDANIVATMQAHGINQLITHNVADFTRFSGVITLIPL